jgi:hypothetical protein
VWERKTQLNTRCDATDIERERERGCEKEKEGEKEKGDEKE